MGVVPFFGEGEAVANLNISARVQYEKVGYAKKMMSWMVSLREGWQLPTQSLYCIVKDSSVSVKCVTPVYLCRVKSESRDFSSRFLLSERKVL